MSTNAVISDPTSTSAVLPIKKENANFAVIVEMDEKGKITDVSATSREKAIADIKAPGYEGKKTIAFEQTVVKSTIGTLDGFEQLIPDADVRLDIINIGLRSKFTSKVVTTLTELDSEGNLAFQPVEPAFDATALLQAASERVVTSPTEKALKTLSALDPATLAAVMAQFQAIQAAQSNS